MKKLLSTIAVLTSNLLCAHSFPAFQTSQEVQHEINFLTAANDQVGFAYQGTAGQLKGLWLPLSYYSTADYWGKYVGTLAGADLHVTDVYDPNSYTLTPAPQSPGKDLQIERVNVYNGTDIYDSACWQIALALAANAGLTSADGTDLIAMAENQDTLLTAGYDGNAANIVNGANRATSASGIFSYNGEKISAANQAYFFRMITRNWLSTDPFMGTAYMQYIHAQDLPANPDYQAGKITWQDWKPITGENAWAFFIGALQTALLKQKKLGQKYVPFSTVSVQNALGVLFALRCMQSELGAIYYACKGSLGNQGDQPVNPYEVSVENNASALAGLTILQRLLADQLAYETDLSSGQKGQIEEALAQVKTMIYGGATPQGSQTKGLLSFFKNQAWDANNGIFYQGGLANAPGAAAWQPTVEPKAVDVTTWGISVLGQPLIDSWHGFGSAYQAWQHIKTWGAFYGPNNALWGVGYSDQDSNGPGKNYRDGIISAEWTAGAINLLRCLIAQYEAASSAAALSETQRQAAADYVKVLQHDHDSMATHILTLRNDLYAETDAYAEVCPKDYNSLIHVPADKLAFVYASKRYAIPFGWFANPLPSTTSTAWAIMLHYNFNPFQAGGGYTPPSFQLGES